MRSVISNLLVAGNPTGPLVEFGGGYRSVRHGQEESTLASSVLWLGATVSLFAVVAAVLRLIQDRGEKPR